MLSASQEHYQIYDQRLARLLPNDDDLANLTTTEESTVQSSRDESGSEVNKYFKEK